MRSMQFFCILSILWILVNGSLIQPPTTAFLILSQNLLSPNQCKPCFHLNSHRSVIIMFMPTNKTFIFWASNQRTNESTKFNYYQSYCFQGEKRTDLSKCHWKINKNCFSSFKIVRISHVVAYDKNIIHHFIMLIVGPSADDNPNWRAIVSQCSKLK